MEKKIGNGMYVKKKTLNLPSTSETYHYSHLLNLFHDNIVNETEENDSLYSPRNITAIFFSYFSPDNLKGKKKPIKEY